MTKLQKELLKEYEIEYRYTVYNSLVLENNNKKFTLTAAEKDQFYNDYLLHNHVLSVLHRIFINGSKELNNTLPDIRFTAVNNAKNMYNNYLIGKGSIKNV